MNRDSQPLPNPSSLLVEPWAVLPAEQFLSQGGSGGSCLPVGDPLGREFVRQLATQLLKDPKYRRLPAMVATGYWFRETAVESWLARTFPSDQVFVPRGTVFHVPPANVETTFLYVWLLSVLCGNRNVVRVASQENEVVTAALGLIAELLNQDRFALLRRANHIVRYGHQREITDRLSAQCDVRVVWGSDETVQTIRQSSIAPTAIELNFAEKTSFGVVDVATVLAAGDAELEGWAEGLLRDSVPFGQMACNSVRALWWLGGTAEETAAARDRFWRVFDRQSRGLEVDWSMAGMVRRRELLDLLGLAGTTAQLDSAAGSLFERVWLDEPAWCDEWFAGHGVLFEAAVGNLDELRPHLDRCRQTVSSLGVRREQWWTFLRSVPPGGIDRVVDWGHSLSFGHVWDGFDLGRQLTREIDVAL